MKLNSPQQLNLTFQIIIRTGTTDHLKCSSPVHAGTAILVQRKIIHLETQLNTQIQSTSILIKVENNKLLITSVYKPPNATQTTGNLDILTRNADWIISAGDFNAKHPMWHSRGTNPAGTTLYNHVTHNDYSIVTPDSPTYFLSTARYHPDVLDLALTRIIKKFYVSNLNELSSDHNPILLELSDFPNIPSPSLPKKFVNWKKYSELIGKAPWISNSNLLNKFKIHSSIANPYNNYFVHWKQLLYS